MRETWAVIYCLRPLLVAVIAYGLLALYVGRYRPGE